MNTLRRKLFLISVLILTIQLVSGQGRMKQADKQYERMNYLTASQLYEEVLQKDPANKSALLKLALCYRKLKETKKAEKILSKITRLDSIPSENLLYYAQALASNGKYEESKEWYQKYQDIKEGADSVASRFVNSYQNLGTFYTDSSLYQVKYTSLNSNVSEFSPVFYKSGLVFTGSRRDETGIIRKYNYDQSPFLDLYYVADTNQIKEVKTDTTEALTSGKKRKSYRENDDDTELTANDSKALGYYHNKAEVTEVNKDSQTEVSKFASSLNTKYHDGPVTFFSSGDSMIFTRNNFLDGKRGESKEGVNKLKLYAAKLKDGNWGEIKELPFNNDQYSVGHPSLSLDNKRLYFVSDMPGGFGGTDIYVSQYESGQWAKPVNLGKEINTAANEMFPFIDSTNTLYFSSEGLGGLGGLDLFFTKLRDDGTPSNIVNMGYPVNSDKDDFGITVDRSGKAGYFSSNRKRGVGDDDIYRFTYGPRAGIRLEGIVVRVGTEAPIDSVTVELREIQTVKEKAVTPADGKFKMTQFKPNTDYEVIAIKPGLSSPLTKITTKGTPPGGVIYVKLYMDKGIQFVLNGALVNLSKGSPVGGDTITLYNVSTKRTIKTPCDQYGRFEFNLDGGSKYEVKGKGTNTVKISTEGKTTSEVFTALLYTSDPNDCEQLKLKFFVENIYYDLDKFDVRADAQASLEKIVSLMKDNPNMTIDFTSHTDSRASRKYNDWLSQKRSQSVYDYLIAKGIPKDRLSFASYGEERLVNRCGNSITCPETEQQRNRRTEFFVYLNKINITKVKCR
jgi:outer membrane protein OmpA-like peptidoglycan-associated protein/tetratricopeptide (TPR) repeat protein